MARPLQFIEVGSCASGQHITLASVPSGADNAIVRVDTGTVRWGEVATDVLTASRGLLLSGADPAFRVDGGGMPSGGLTRFRALAMGGGAAVMVAYYGYEGRGFTL